jgi:hypothetical protein
MFSFLWVLRFPPPIKLIDRHNITEILQENARESELELREDLDLANGKVAEVGISYTVDIHDK